MSYFVTLSFLIVTVSCGTPEKFTGRYEHSDDYAGVRIQIESNYRFKVWWWMHSRVYDSLPSTIGRWEKTSQNNIIKLFSDKIPEYPKYYQDPKLKGICIKIKEGDSLSYLDLTDVALEFPDTTVYLKPDSTGTITWTGSYPRLINVYSVTSFQYIHIIDNDPNSPFVVKTKQKYSNTIITCGPETSNVIEVTLQYKYEFLNGDSYLLKDNQLFHLDYGLSRLLK